MDSKSFRVVQKDEPETITNKKGETMKKCRIILKEDESDFGDQFVCAMFGPQCDNAYQSGDLVLAKLQFLDHQFQGNHYPEIYARSLVKLAIGF